MDISTLIYSHCQNPTKVSIYNGITNRYEIREVPCGKCYHCKITKINEWVTRMVIQSNYSKYVYFGTLTYSSLNPTQYTYDCLPCKSNFNKQKRWCDSPMILRKDHVQKFLKRLRKNTGIKLQYAYCGEYGSTYSRPHYHYIIWSNDPIKKSDIYKAWRAPSIQNPKRTNIIGRVDHVDIKNNPREISKNGVESVYKYVCKYIQKTDFNFKELKNYETHKQNYHSWFEKQILLCIKHDNFIQKLDIKNFYDYQKVFSPFFHCSKKPAIGFQYLQDHLNRFQNSDFSLYGLSGDYIFPLYYVRKTKESLCPIKPQSETNETQTTFSRIPKMAALLYDIETTQLLAENYDQIIRPFEYQNTDNGRYYLQTRQEHHDIKLLDKFDTISSYQSNDPDLYEYLINPKYLEFVNKETNVRYIFKGYHYTMLNSSTGEYLGDETLENVQHLLIYYYERVKPLLLSLMSKSKISTDKKDTLIKSCGGIDDFNLKKQMCLESLNRQIAARQHRYKLTKTIE